MQHMEILSAGYMDKRPRNIILIVNISYAPISYYIIYRPNTKIRNIDVHLQKAIKLRNFRGCVSFELKNIFFMVYGRSRDADTMEI